MQYFLVAYNQTCGGVESHIASNHTNVTICFFAYIAPNELQDFLLPHVKNEAYIKGMTEISCM